MLIDGLGLQFGTVSLALNRLANHDPHWWAIGKLCAYAAQDEPFIHIDNDVFLWEPLPQALEEAPVFAQHPEYSSYGASFYRPESIEYDIRRYGGWMPKEFEHYMPIGGVLKIENCGIVGGTRTDFIRHYAGQAIRFIEHPANQRVWEQRPRREEDFVTCEQLMLSACVAYHQGRTDSPFADIAIAYLFPSHEDAHTHANERGYTHLASDSKRNPGLCAHLERAVAQEFPVHYQRCLDFLSNRERTTTVAGDRR